MNPLISVLLPVRNGGRWLRLAVDSVLGQTWRELELLLIDDCSSDGAIEALPADPRLRILRAPHPGIVAALNHGLALAGGDWTVLGFIDVHPRRIGGSKRGLPVWPRSRLSEPIDAFGLFAVGSPGARERIRGEMASTPLREGEDWIFVA